MQWYKNQEKKTVSISIKILPHYITSRNKEAAFYKKKVVLLGTPIFIIQRYIKVQEFEREILILFSFKYCTHGIKPFKVKLNKHTNYLVSTFFPI